MNARDGSWIGIKKSGRTSRPWYALAQLVFVALAVPGPAAAQGPTVVYEVQSKYQHITVVDTAYGFRQLIFDAQLDGSDPIQSELELANPDVPTLSYARHVMASLPLVAAERRILVVGLGGACIQRFLHKLLPDAVIETAELDPEVRKVAAAYFFLKEDARQLVHIGDGRAFIEGSKDKYDLIILDAFSATSIPYHLSTREFLQAVRARLAPGGVVCANLWDSEASFWDMVRTYAAVFPELHILRCSASANSLVMAMPERVGLTVQGWEEKASAFEKAHPTGLDLPSLIERGAAATVDIPNSARILLDKKGSGLISGFEPSSAGEGVGFGFLF